MNEKWDHRFLELAKHISTWSKDPSTKTGAVIVRVDRTILSTGYNGFPKQMPDHEAYYNERSEKYSRIVHCEVNALIHARSSVDGCTLYTYPFICCDRCAVQMIQAGIKRFVTAQPTQDALSRWADQFIKARAFINECAGVSYTELPQ